MSDIFEALKSRAPLDQRQEAINLVTRGRTIHDEVYGITQQRLSVPLDGCELRDLDLSGLDIARVPISNALLRGVTAKRTRFAHLTRCELKAICGVGAAFPRLTNCIIREADLRNADFGPFVFACAFEDTNLAGAHFGQVSCERQVDTPQTSFTNCDMSNVQATGSNFRQSHFRSIQLAGARLTRCILEGCVLSDVDLRGANLIGSRFENVNLVQTTLDEAIISTDQAIALHQSGVSCCKAHVISIRHAAAFGELASILDGLADFFIEWRMTSSEGTNDRIIIYADEKAYPFAGSMAFRSLHPFTDVLSVPEVEHRDSYAIDGPRNVADILVDIACDYVGWTPDLDSLMVCDVDERTRGLVHELTRDALTQLSSVAHHT